MPIIVYPPPRRLRLGKQHICLTERVYIHLHDNPSEYLQDAVLRFARQRNLQLTAGVPDPRHSLLSLHLTNRVKEEEGYRISTGESGLLLEARTETGLFRGLGTVGQVLDTGTSAEGMLPRLEVEDAPAFRHRGVMLDISRCKVPTLDTLKQLINQFAGLKYNQLQLYTEHTFAFVNHAEVWAGVSPLTAADMLELKQYCLARYIELVPNLNSFGHFERWLRHAPYRHLAECPDGFTHPLTGQKIEIGSTLKPNRASLRLLDELHSEYLPLFDSEYFNVGGDEPWELGQGWSKSRCEARGTTTVYVDFLLEIQHRVAKHGRQMMFWSDIVQQEPASIANLSKDLIALNWGYEGNHPFKRECERVAARKLPFYVCPGTSSWNSLIGRTDNLERNLANAAANGRKFGAEGLLVTDWGDHGHHQYLPISYPGFALAACQAWHPMAAGKLDLADMVNRHFLDSSAPDLAGLLVRLGRVLELAPSRIRNATIFNRLVFWGMKNEPSATTSISDKQLTRCIDELDSLNAELTQERNHPLVVAELKNAIGLARHGLNRLQYFRGTLPDKTPLRAELLRLMAHHQDLWLSRNQPGGLMESLGHLNRSLGALPD